MDMQALAARDQTDVIVGFFDLSGFANWCEERPPRKILELATELFRRTGRAIDAAGGKLIKPIGDAGLFVFPDDDPDRVVDALREMKRDCDRWLTGMGYPDSMVVKARLGPVACGQVGAPGDERFDVYGVAVNRAADMRGRKFTLSADLVSCLKPGTQRTLAEFSDDEFIAAD